MITTKMKRILCATVALSLAAGSGLAAPRTKPLELKEVLRVAGLIDEMLEKDLKAKEVKPLPSISDETFLRRSYVTVVGRIPTAQEAATFLDSKDGEKRTKLIESLVNSPGYDSSAFNYFADLLRVQTGHEQYGLGWHVWLRKSLNEDKPWDKIVAEMLSADGHAVKNPAVGYYLRDRGMVLDNVSNTVQVFLGHQIGCAQCHDHPFDKWTQMEYYELASFSGGIRYDSQEARDAMGKVVAQYKKTHPEMARATKSKDKRARANAQRNIARKATGEVRYVFRDFRKNEIVENEAQNLKLPDDYKYDDADPGEVIDPATLFGPKVKNVKPEDRRKAFAQWVTSPENPYFTKVIANRLWDRTFGHGLVDPIDDWNSKSIGSHPEVLTYLEKVMKGVNYRTRDFERILYHTKLFQREVAATEATPGTDYYFAGPQLRRLAAEELYDSFTVLAFGNTDDNINTGLEEKWDSYKSGILDLLGSDARKLLQVGREAQAAEEARREYQRKTREVQMALTKARKAGNRKEATRLESRISAIKREARTKANSMTSMVMNRYPGRSARASLNMRASEHPTPFRGDHLVRQFGGSDRNTPEAAHTQASVPQALTLLNGQVANSAENRKSKVFEALAEITSPEMRLEYLFLAFYASRPTAEEKAELLPLASDADDLFTLARAMLTSKRFLFVQ